MKTKVYLGSMCLVKCSTEIHIQCNWYFVKTLSIFKNCCYNENMELCWLLHRSSKKLLFGDTTALNSSGTFSWFYGRFPYIQIENNNFKSVMKVTTIKSFITVINGSECLNWCSMAFIIYSYLYIGLSLYSNKTSNKTNLENLYSTSTQWTSKIFWRHKKTFILQSHYEE